MAAGEHRRPVPIESKSQAAPILSRVLPPPTSWKFSTGSLRFLCRPFARGVGQPPTLFFQKPIMVGFSTPRLNVTARENRGPGSLPPGNAVLGPPCRVALDRRLLAAQRGPAPAAFAPKLVVARAVIEMRAERSMNRRE